MSKRNMLSDAQKVLLWDWLRENAERLAPLASFEIRDLVNTELGARGVSVTLDNVRNTMATLGLEYRRQRRPNGNRRLSMIQLADELAELQRRVADLEEALTCPDLAQRDEG